MILATIAVTLALQQVPPGMIPEKAPDKQLVERQVAEKQAAFVAQTTNAALQQDIGLLLRLDAPFPKPTSFNGTPAGEVLKAIRDAAKVPIELDRRAIGEASAWDIKPIRCEPATMRQAPDALVREITPAYTELFVDVAAGIVVITDDDGQTRLKASAQYPLGVTLARLGAPEADAGALEIGRAELEDFLALTNPDAWESRGGGVARIAWTGTVATIDAPPSFHHDIRRRLTTLEAALPSVNLLWLVGVYEFKDASDDEIADALVRPETLERLLQDGRAKQLGAPRLLARHTDPAEIRMGDGDESLIVRIEPAAESRGREFVVRTSVGKEAAPAASAAMRAVPGVRAAVAFRAGERRLAVDALGLSELAQKLLKR